MRPFQLGRWKKNKESVAQNGGSAYSPGPEGPVDKIPRDYGGGQPLPDIYSDAVLTLYDGRRRLEYRETFSNW